MRVAHTIFMRMCAEWLFHTLKISHMQHLYDCMSHVIRMHESCLHMQEACHCARVCPSGSSELNAGTKRVCVYMCVHVRTYSYSCVARVKTHTYTHSLSKKICGNANSPHSLRYIYIYIHIYICICIGTYIYTYGRWFRIGNSSNSDHIININTYMYTAYMYTCNVYLCTW